MNHLTKSASLLFGSGYLFLLGKFLFSLGLGFLLSFAFLEKRLGNEDLVLGWNSAANVNGNHNQLWGETYLPVAFVDILVVWVVVVGCSQCELMLRLVEVLAVTNPQKLKNLWE